MDMDAKKSDAAYGWIGALAVTVLTVIWIAAYSADISWNLNRSCFSDPGMNINDDVARYLSYGCVLAGILFATYGAGKATKEIKLTYRVAGIATAFAGLAMVMIGVFNRDCPSGDYMHVFLFAAKLFIAASIIAQSSGLWNDGGNKRIIAGIGIIFMITLLSCYFKGAFEHTAAVLIMVWYALDAATYIATKMDFGKKISQSRKMPKMMADTSKSMKIGLAFAVSGGIFCFFALAYDTAVSNDGTNGMHYVADILLYALVSVLFFALAGGFSRHAQWTQNVLIFMAFVTAGTCIAGIATGALVLWFGIVSAVLAVFCITVAFLDGTARYLAFDHTQ